MVIQREQLPFSLELWNYTVRSTNHFYVDTFCDNINEFNRINLPLVEIKENWSLDIKFTANQEARLELDGFDALDIANLTHSDGKYLEATGERISTFSYDNFPLPPGKYAIKIQINNKEYISGFEVVSIRMNDSTWEQMSIEVLDSIKLMAFQLVNRKIFIDKFLLGENLIGSLILKINVLEKHFNKVISALDAICINPHCKISKKYNLETTQELYIEDFKAKKMNSIKNNYHRKYMMRKYTDYNLNENCYIKLLVLNLEKNINEFLSELGDKRNYIKKKIEQDKYFKEKKSGENIRDNEILIIVNNYYRKVEKIKNAIYRIKNVEWFNMISTNKFYKVPIQSMLDPRYGILSKLSRDLRANTIRYDINNNLSFIWKNSSKLYELWSTLKIVKSLQALGFELKNGMNIEKIENTYKITCLDSGDIFELQSNVLLVKISYDIILPNKSNDTDKIAKPIYTTGNHNRPDCRIDFYYIQEDEEVYITSLIIDFKYRAKNSIWGYDGDCKRQLISYANDTKSIYIENKNEKESLRIRPVAEVWALYPDKQNQTDEAAKDDYSVRLISFVPGYEDVIKRKLKNFINDYIYPYLEHRKL